MPIVLLRKSPVAPVKLNLLG